MLKTDLYSAKKSKDSEALDSGTSQLGILSLTTTLEENNINGKTLIEFVKSV